MMCKWNDKGQQIFYCKKDEHWISTLTNRIYFVILRKQHKSNENGYKLNLFNGKEKRNPKKKYIIMLEYIDTIWEEKLIVWICSFDAEKCERGRWIDILRDRFSDRSPAALLQRRQHISCSISFALLLSSRKLAPILHETRFESDSKWIPLSIFVRSFASPIHRNWICVNAFPLVLCVEAKTKRKLSISVQCFLDIIRR